MSSSSPPPAAGNSSTSMPEELRLMANELLDAKTPDPAAFLELAHQVRLRVLFALEQVYDGELLGFEDVSKEYKRLVKKQDAFQAASARMFMPVVAGWRREAMLSERDGHAPTDGPDAPLSVQQVLDDYYTLSSDLSAIYYPSELDDLELLRKSTDTLAVVLRRNATSLADLKRELKYIVDRRRGLNEVTRMFVSSGLAFVEAYEREVQRVHLSTQSTQSRLGTSHPPAPQPRKSPSQPGASSSRRKTESQAMDVDEREDSETSNTSKRSHRPEKFEASRQRVKTSAHLAPPVEHPVPISPQHQLQLGDNLSIDVEREEPQDESTRLVSPAPESLRVAASPSPALSRSSQSQKFDGVVIPVPAVRDRVREAAMNQQTKLGQANKALPRPTAFYSSQASRQKQPLSVPIRPTPHSRSRLAAPAKATQPQPTENSQEDTSGTTAATSSLDPPPPGQRMRTSSDPVAAGEPHPSAEAATEEEQSSLEVIPGTLSDREDETEDPIARGPSFKKLEKESTEEYDDETDVRRLADVVDRDVES